MNREQFRGALRGTANHINASLPSTDSAKAFLAGAPGSTGKIIGSTLLRSVLIAPGLLLAGIEPKKAVLGAVLGSVGISTFILIFVASKPENARPLQLKGRGAKFGAVRQPRSPIRQRRIVRPAFSTAPR